ncbi:MAG: hypothetical protein U0414_35740 [Polyangiaceae bacterium]
MRAFAILLGGTWLIFVAACASGPAASSSGSPPEIATPTGIVSNAPTASAPPPPTVTSAGPAAPPATEAYFLDGTVLGVHVCPPCPPGALCKPCESYLTVSGSDAEVRVQTDDPARFAVGSRVHLKVVPLRPNEVRAID